MKNHPSLTIAYMRNLKQLLFVKYDGSKKRNLISLSRKYPKKIIYVILVKQHKSFA